MDSYRILAVFHICLAGVGWFVTLRFAGLGLAGLQICVGWAMAGPADLAAAQAVFTFMALRGQLWRHLWDSCETAVA